MQTIARPKKSQNTKRRIVNATQTVVRKPKTEPEQDDCTCGRWECRRCSCRRYSGKEEGGYKCNNCNHPFEDHK